MTEDGLSLEVVSEELRVADEELRTQQEVIDKLVRGRLADELATSRLAAAVPVPLVDTDGAGAILRANPAAGALLHLDVVRLRGKPLLAYVEAGDRRAVRTALTRAAAGRETTHLVAHLTPRKDGVVLVDIAVLPGEPGAVAEPAREPEPGDQPSLRARTAARWVLSPRNGGEEQDIRALSALAAMSTLPVVTGELRSVLHRVAALTVEGTAVATCAALTVGPPAEPELMVSTDTLAQSVEGAQFHHGGGPAWDAYSSAGPVSTEDLGADPRWAGLGDLLPEAEGTAAIAVPLLDGTAPVGVLTLVGTPALTRPAQIAKAMTFGGTVAALIREHRAVADLRRVEDQLRTALTSRADIDQAKGILMARLGIDADRAFQELIRVSQHSNMKLRDVARQIVGSATATDPAPDQALGRVPSRRGPAEPF